VVQDAFLSQHRSLTAGGSPENARAWLFRVAHNAARNRQKSYHRRFGAPLESEAFDLADGSTPERAVLKKERYREIGEVPGLATSTVAGIVDRAVKKLAEKCNV
jgi:DNA-directed RNA polymerase specialized sigma24 family protein